MRVDSGVLSGSEITPLYDPMVAKLIVRDTDREGATARMLRALREFEIEGVTTLIPFHKAIMASEQWAKGETCRDLIGDRKWLKELAQPKPEKRDDDEPEPVERTYTVEVSGKRFDVTVHGEPMVAPANGAAPAQARKPARSRARQGRRRRRRRRAHLPAPGQHVEGAGGEGRRRSRRASSSASSRR